jgi:pimeloyl-ACP methyl ester carboxylesterase
MRMPDAELNGYQHHWEDSGSGEPLVMLHGAAGSGKQLVQHVPELSKTYRVIIPDMRGLGQSARVSSSPPNAWVEDLKALLDHLGIDKAHVFGLSVGGRVAMRFTIDYPERVRSLIVDVPIAYSEQEAQAGVATQVDPSKMSAARLEEMRRVHGDDWETAVSFYQRFRAQPDWQEYLDLRERSKRITAPTLIMRGDAPGDTYKAEHAFILYQNIPGCWLWIRPNTEGGLLRNAKAQVYELIRELTATASTEKATA